MRAIAGASERGPLVSVALLLGSLSILAVAVLNEARVKDVAVLVGVGAVCVAAYRVLLSWRALIAGLALVIFFIPIKRYSLPAELPFELEPYRLFVAFILLGWAASLLVDPSVRLRRTGLEGPVALIVASILASELANPARVAELGPYVAKALTFEASFILLLFFLVSVVRRREHLDYVLKVLVVGGAIVAATVALERRFHYNVFEHLEGVVPLLRQELSFADYYNVEFRLRVLGSAQHPIAMGAAFALLLPAGLYLLITTHARRWWIPVALLFVGTIATAARTAFVMLVVGGIVLLLLRWRDLRGYVPALLPLLILTWMAAPGSVGTLRSSFFPPGGLVAEQQTVVPGNENLANNRLADIGPALQELSRKPLFGQGYGTRIAGFHEPFNNAAILDNQWLKLLLETGLVGLVAWLLLFGRVLRRLVARARSDTSADGWLAAALAASIAAFGLGMFTYDALSFIQVTFVFFILLGLASVTVNRPREPASIGLQPRPTVEQRRSGEGLEGARPQSAAGWVPLGHKDDPGTQADEPSKPEHPLERREDRHEP